MPKFFIDKETIEGESAFIRGSDVGHITKVLRLVPGGAIRVCDGDGSDYDAEITRIEKDLITLRLLQRYACETEPQIKVTLFQGIPKAAKMEYIIQKCTELGVSEIVPVLTKRTVVKLENAQTEKKKLDRWNKIAAEAVKQCGRGKIPPVSPVTGIKELCGRIAEFDLVLAAYEAEEHVSLRSVLRAAGDVKSVGIIIGPEGGFEPEEVGGLCRAGAKSVSLGKRILRTETAGHTALTAVLYEAGELE